MSRVALGILSFLMGVGLAGSGHAEKRVALIVGNAAYIQGELQNTLNDAILVADVLRSRGFNLVKGKPLLNLDKLAFDDAVRQLGNELRGADVGLFYFAGHAVNVNGTNFLLPVSANPMSASGVKDQAIEATSVLSQMTSAGTSLNLMILDASRDTSFGGNFRATERGLARIAAPAGTLVSFAAQPGTVASNDTGDHSVFTRALTEIVRRPGLSLFDVFRELELAVQGTTAGAQRPWVMINSPVAGRFSFTQSLPAESASGVILPAPREAVLPPASNPASPLRAPSSSPAEKAKPVKPAKTAIAPSEIGQPRSTTPRKPVEAKQAATPRLSSPAAPAAGRCRSIQALCSLEIGGCCDQASGRWEYGRNGCGGSTLAFNNCISRRLAGRK